VGIAQLVTEYVLTNEAMPGLVKTGKTKQGEPQVRMGQLYGTGFPGPFGCAMAMRVSDLNAVEQALHTAFGPATWNGANCGFEDHQPAATEELPGNMETSDNEHVVSRLILLKPHSDCKGKVPRCRISLMT